MRYFLLLAPLLLLVGCDTFAAWLDSGGAEAIGETATVAASFLPPPFNYIAEGTGGLLTVLLGSWAAKKGYDNVKKSPDGTVGLFG